jgi:HSP20 family protein
MTNEIEKRESRADPWSDLDRVFTELRDRLFETYGLEPFGAPSGPVAAFRVARTDVSDTGASYRVVAEVPGIPKEKLDIRVRGTTVEIRGEQGVEREEHGAEYVHRERTYAGYYRAVELPEPVVAAEAKAKVENGLLELELPKEHPKNVPAEVKVPVP